MAVDNEAVKQIAYLARLGVEEDKLEETQREFNKILSWVEELGEVDTKDVAPMVSPYNEDILLRQDNADARLTEIGHDIGLIDDTQYSIFKNKQETIQKEIERLKETKISATEVVNEILAKYGEHIDRGMRMAELLKRPNITYETFREIDSATKDLNLSEDITGEVEVLIKYDGYIARQEQQVESTEKLEKYKIPANIDYSQIKHISTETKEKLEKVRPTNLAQASRIGGVKPADISVLMVMLKG